MFRGIDNIIWNIPSFMLDMKNVLQKKMSIPQNTAMYLNIVVYPMI